MFTHTLQRSLLRWLLCELSTDCEDMIAFVRSLPDCDDDDAQALLEELNATPKEVVNGPLVANYQDGKQLLLPREAMRTLELSRPLFYALVKRGTFPPVLVDDSWLGWPRAMLLEWADTSVRQKSANSTARGYSPFERSLTK